MKTFLLRLEDYEMKALKYESIRKEITVTEVIKLKLKDLFEEYEEELIQKFKKIYQEKKDRQ